MAPSVALRASRTASFLRRGDRFASYVIAVLMSLAVAGLIGGTIAWGFKPLTTFSGTRVSALHAQFDAWQGVFRAPVDWSQVGRAAWVSVLYVAVPLVAAQIIFRRRDVAGPLIARLRARRLGDDIASAPRYALRTAALEGNAMWIHVSDADAVDDLREYLRRCDCTVELRGATELEASPPGRDVEPVYLRMELDAYLRVWRAMHPGVTADIA
ncbi:MAG: hypothetical protein E6G64_05640 [Actinobacteria bacterium]|nr:MAG: hypothetical protein E6G64_05640 [Actinomycetota bacterium]